MNAPTSAQTALDAELARWREANRHARLFLRDDDAVDITDALERLTDLCERHRVPVLLACVPARLKAPMRRFVDDHPLFTPAVHGYAHTNHAPAGEKKMELGDHRPIEMVLGELARALDVMLDVFGENLSRLLVPPWNRIADTVATRSGELGFAGISGFSWREPPAGVVAVNTHVDLIDWAGGRFGKDHAVLYEELAQALATARERAFAPVGLLTHHLDHDEGAWAFLEGLLAFCEGRSEVRWVAADDLIDQP